MTAQIDPLLDIQTKVLRATFVNNMAVLKKYMPDVFKFYQNYRPTRVKLTFDDNGHLNLVSNGSLIYQDDPKQSSDQQVSAFLRNPHNITYHVGLDTGAGIYEHEKVLAKIIGRRQQDVGFATKKEFPADEQIDFIAFMGTGLGYHLQSLFETNEIRYAFVYEPDPDCFYCTMHSVDIGDMIKGCFARGGQLTLQIGGNANGFVNEIAKIFKRTGYFNVAKMFLYRHYRSEDTDEAFQMIHDISYRYVNGWGFCEDEIIGISHSLTNISDNKYPSILGAAKQNKREQPVFVVGNGPSLDASFEYLKANQNNAIIIACGTALKPLLDKGVLPDIHVEVERPAENYDWIKNIGHKEKLKQMDLICLNTVYPETLKTFKQAHIILKPGDAGCTFIREYISDKYAEIHYSNPTVSNAASAAAVAMGFKKLYLFGVDYGFKSEEHHHSKESAYFKDNEELDVWETKGEFVVPGNFCDEVYTNQFLDSSRMALEMLLQANLDVCCINTSDGAKVEISVPCKIANLPEFNKIDEKEKVIAEILEGSFDSRDYIKRDLIKEFESLLPAFQSYVNQLTSFVKNVQSRTELSEAFSKQYKFVNDIQHNHAKKLFYEFFGGTLNYMQANIMSNVYLYKEKEQQEQYIAFCLDTFTAHLEWLFVDLKEHYNKPARA